MFDQRELTLPVERTFQNQRPGEQQQLRVHDAHVHRLHLGGEAAVARDPQVVALGALGLVPAERDLRALDDRSAARAQPASGRGDAWTRPPSPRRRRPSARPRMTLRPRAAESRRTCPYLCISTQVCATSSPARGDVAPRKAVGPKPGRPQSSVRRPRTSASDRPSRERNQKPRPTPSVTSITCRPTANAIACGKSIG